MLRLAGYTQTRNLVPLCDRGVGPGSHGFFASLPVHETLLVGYGSFGITGAWWHFNGTIDETLIFDRSPLAEFE